MNDDDEICCLCGKPGTDEDPITAEHVPPRQFYPKSVRKGVNLWTDMPTHKSCNGKNKLDEEYFYHVLYPLVANANPAMAAVIMDDLKRRARKPQTPRLMRSILSKKRTTTKGGIVLPPSVVGIDAKQYRLEQVAIKIGRCLFYRDHRRVMPYENCKDIRLCEREEDVPEMYAISWGISKANVHALTPIEPGGVVVVADAEAGQPTATCPQVFDYRPAYVGGLHLYTLRFWESFAFCMAFEDPQPGFAQINR